MDPVTQILSGLGSPRTGVLGPCVRSSLWGLCSSSEGYPRRGAPSRCRDAPVSSGPISSTGARALASAGIQLLSHRFGFAAFSGELVQWTWTSDLDLGGVGHGRHGSGSGSPPVHLLALLPLMASAVACLIGSDDDFNVDELDEDDEFVSGWWEERQRQEAAALAQHERRLRHYVHTHPDDPGVMAAVAHTQAAESATPTSTASRRNSRRSRASKNARRRQRAAVATHGPSSLRRLLRAIIHHGHVFPSMLSPTGIDVTYPSTTRELVPIFDDCTTVAERERLAEDPTAVALTSMGALSDSDYPDEEVADFWHSVEHYWFSADCDFNDLMDWFALTEGVGLEGDPLPRIFAVLVLDLLRAGGPLQHHLAVLWQWRFLPDTALASAGCLPAVLAEVTASAVALVQLAPPLPPRPHLDCSEHHDESGHDLDSASFGAFALAQVETEQDVDVDGWP
mmetsp:Transcript_44027/g.95476  ORF Transcript_44027/g.95476 Transcript_44027/m.95476 type:complete len:453 (-) Transcript_44027:153-1511(-)